MYEDSSRECPPSNLPNAPASQRSTANSDHSSSTLVTANSTSADVPYTRDQRENIESETLKPTTTMRKIILQRLSRGLTAKRSYRLAAGLTALAVVALCATSCNVTRTITTKSEYWQKADTSVIIQTKTIESYNAEKRL